MGIAWAETTKGEAISSHQMMWSLTIMSATFPSSVCTYGQDTRKVFKLSDCSPNMDTYYSPGVLTLPSNYGRQMETRSCLEATTVIQKQCEILLSALMVVILWALAMIKLCIIGILKQGKSSNPSNWRTIHSAWNFILSRNTCILSWWEVVGRR